MNYGFRKVLVPCCLLIHSLILSPSLSSKSLRGRSPKQGLINIELVPSIYLRLFLQNLCEGVARSKVL